MQPLSSTDADALLLFSLLPNVGQGKLRRLLATAQKLDQSLDHWWQQEQVPANISLCENMALEIQNVKKEYTGASYRQWLDSLHIRVIFLWQSYFPYWLTIIERPPVLLYCQGPEEPLLHPLPIAIVGNRAITPYGRSVTRQITKQLVLAGASIVSGFMYGVDTVAHQVALQTGGQTVAVVGYGLNQTFPESHRQLKEEWLASGQATFVSCFPPNYPALPDNFPIRNGIVAGMSLATVVTEAAKKSGSHITAQFALDFNRVVCAVPGPISNLNSEGTKWLINQGALMVTSGQDVVEGVRDSGLGGVSAYASNSQQGLQVGQGGLQGSSRGETAKYASIGSRGSTFVHPPFQLSLDQERVLTALQSGSLTFEQLQIEFSLSAAQLGQILSYLEMQGLIEPAGETYVAVG